MHYELYLDSMFPPESRYESVTSDHGRPQHLPHCHVVPAAVWSGNRSGLLSAPFFMEGSGST